MVITYLAKTKTKTKTKTKHKFSLIESWLNKLVLEDLVGLQRTIQLPGFFFFFGDSE